MAEKLKKILIINKFLYPNGGSETYIFKLGEELKRQGHEVQYFGMNDERNIVGNKVNAYTSNMDFHTGKLAKLMYPFKIIYSIEARKEIRKVLKDFEPDVIHLNNFNFQITPSVIFEIKKYEKKTGKNVRILFTAHDYQLVCPNHMLRGPISEQNCEKCLGGNYGYCVRGKCIHGSLVKSILGAAEGYFYRIFKAYRYIDTVICPSYFIQEKLEQHPQLSGKTVVMHNFSVVSQKVAGKTEKGNYVIYFGRYSKEKGIESLLNACEKLPHIPFVFAGKGPLEEKVNQLSNIENRGFLSGEELKQEIQKAKFSIYPSEWYENCPFSVMESIENGTPVLGARIGGIPELIDEGETGELFESGNEAELVQKIEYLWENDEKLKEYSDNCWKKDFTGVEEYVERLIDLYSAI